ncbi:solute carrier family 25 member 53 [Sinocyclocheilus grahami]|uniref:Solute carrier family 25 member 53 n=1 Tax=Sinocyclocheilus grahami TaxID=75366 RepID=A0A672L313_SINGR|nr:PREDICTED: solute carrier family 25 member 53 [Sinocyclocheilus grahami]XP_016111203.1 PREDICTED: solute carrier family 25 member 53 [Sinocyclocheilus grahami]
MSKESEMGSNSHHNQEAALEPADSTLWFRSYLHGGTSSLISTLTTVITFPLYKTVFRQQLDSTLVREAVAQLLREGPVKLYRGVAPPLLMRSLNGTFLFGFQDTFLQQLSLWDTSPVPRSALPALAGLGAGVLEAVLFTPFERVQNVLQNSKNDTSLPTLRSILRKLASKPLASGYYTAFLPILVRNALGSSLYFGLKDPMSETLRACGCSPLASSFIAGVLNSMVISLPLYPLSVLVANMQAQVDGGGGGVKSSWQRLWAARQHKLVLLYRGGSLVIFRSCITWGITTAIYDQLKRHSRTSG